MALKETKAQSSNHSNQTPQLWMIFVLQCNKPHDNPITQVQQYAQCTKYETGSFGEQKVAHN